MNNIEYSKWLNLGPFYLERGRLGVLDPKLLPVNCDEYDFEYIEDFLNKKGGDIYIHIDLNSSSLRSITKNQIGGIKAIINITE